jgi:hypothetical protein
MGLGYLHNSETTNDKDDDTSKAASSTKKYISSSVHGEATNNDALKYMLVHFEKVLKAIICFSVVMIDSEVETWLGNTRLKWYTYNLGCKTT